MKRKKTAFFDLACCEGCQLKVANLGESLVDLLELIDIVEFRELMSEKYSGEIDLAFVEGSVTNRESEERLKRIRKRSKLILALGSCATIGGINSIRNNSSLNELNQTVYPDKHLSGEYDTLLPIDEFVEVDYYIHGCPVYHPELIKVIKLAVLEIPYEVPDYAVCVECKFNENECMYDKGITCLGPVTRGGCNSWCINNKNTCYGCRGMLSNPNTNGAKDVMKKYNLNSKFILNKMNMYNTSKGVLGEQ